jgi:hypothetical protein
MAVCLILSTADTNLTCNREVCGPFKFLSILEGYCSFLKTTEGFVELLNLLSAVKELQHVHFAIQLLRDYIHCR